MASQSNLLVQLKVFQYLSDASLIRLDCDAATIPPNDAIKYSSTLFKVWISPDHLFLDLILSGYQFDE